MEKKFTTVHHHILNDFKDEPASGMALIQILSNSDKFLEECNITDIQKKYGITKDKWRAIREVLIEKGYYNDSNKVQDKKTGLWIHNPIISDHPIESWKIPRKKKEKKKEKLAESKEVEVQEKIQFNMNAGIINDIKN